MTSNVYICQLSTAVQETIKEDVTAFLKDEGYTGNEINEIIKNVMDGRLVDLEGYLEVSQYIKMQLDERQ